MAEYLSLMTSSSLPGLTPFIRSFVGLGVAIRFLVILLTMYTLVLERRREIGILKALGASRLEICWLILAEALLLVVGGVVFGLAATLAARLPCCITPRRHCRYKSPPNGSRVPSSSRLQGPWPVRPIRLCELPEPIRSTRWPMSKSPLSVGNVEPGALLPRREFGTNAGRTNLTARLCNGATRRTKMGLLRTLGLLGVVTLLAAWPATSQMTMNMHRNLRGVWNPTPGSGRVLRRIDGARGKTDVEISVVGKETVNGKDGFWVEMSMSPNGQGQMYAKNLMSVDGNTASISRTIVQMDSQPAMELPAMMGQNAGQPSSADIRQDAQLVGAEDVTTPAGTFSCEHYKTKDGDAWISNKVTPWGLVKAVGKDQTITVQRVITDAKDHITGTPQKFDPTQMMRQRGGQQPPQ